jgi:zinc and cadmium transporter
VDSHNVLIWIVLATLSAGIISISAAATLSFKFLGSIVENMVSFSVGLLLATAFLHSLPEAFQDSQASTPYLFSLLLAGILFFFMLEKVALLRHNHHHEGDGHNHHAGHDAEEAGKSGWMILVGDGVHNFVDGVLIAAAFIANPEVGILTAIAIIAHEIPQEIGNFMVLLNAGFSKKRALIYNMVCGLLAVVGGVLGYAFLEQSVSWIPYLLVFASSSFIYIAVSDLMPQMNRRIQIRESIKQITLILLGVGLVVGLSIFHH